jgi:hypothetical protein
VPVAAECTREWVRSAAAAGWSLEGLGSTIRRRPSEKHSKPQIKRLLSPAASDGNFTPRLFTYKSELLENR